MASLQWSIKFETGNSDLDGMNKKFVEIINRTANLSFSASKATLNDVIQDLFFYMHKQFSFEESLFEMCDYDSLKHRHDHDDFRSTVKMFEERVEHELEIEGLINDLSRYLRNWFLGHILGKDRDIFRCKKSFDINKNQIYFIAPPTRILIISRSIEAIQLIGNKLDGEGLTLDSSQCGIEALNLCKKKEYSYVLCDYQTKSMEGWRFVKSMKNNINISNIPISLFSSNKELLSKDRLSKDMQINEYGVVSLLDYPMSGSVLQKSIDRSKLLYHNAGSVEFLFKSAKKHMKDSDTKKSLQFMEKIQKENVHTSRLNLGMSNIYKHKGDQKEMLLYLDKSYFLDPDNLSVCYLRYQLAVEQDDKSKISIIPDQLIKKNGVDNITIMFHLTEILFKNLLYEDVLRFYSKYKKFIVNEFSYQIDLVRAKSCLQIGKNEKAYNILLKLIKMSGCAESVRMMAGVCRKRKEYEESILFYKKAIDASPSDYRIMYNLSLVYSHLNDYDNAIAYAIKSNKIEPRFRKSKILLSELLKKNISKS